MLETSARLLQLLTLLQSRREWSGPELAERLEVDVRTVRRDAERLRALGYEVRASSGPGGGYQFGPGRDMPPLLLDDEEALAIAVALRTAASSVARLEHVAIQALAKLEQLLPKRLHARLRALHAVTVRLGPTRDEVDPKKLTELAAACREFERLSFSYASYAASPSERRVEPHRLAHTERRWYLVAWDLDREDWRTFRVDRIEKVLRGARFSARAFPEDVATYVARAISYEPYQVRARILLHESADALRKRLPSWIGVLEPVDEATCILVVGAPSLSAIASHLVFVETEFEVLEPESLNAYLETLSARLARGADRKPTSRRKGRAPKRPPC
jgi:predicted DNA-binding transcriptional regulator YafY